MSKKITGRTKPLSLKSTPEFHQRLKVLASKEKCLMIEILERALEVWEIQRQKDLAKQAMEKENMQPIIREAVTPAKSSKRRLDEIEEPDTSSKKRRFDQ